MIVNDGIIAKQKIKTTIANYILIFMMIMCSGTVIFNIKYNSVFIPIFAVCAISNYFINKRPMISIDFLVIMFVIFLNFLFHLFDEVAINGLIQITLYVIGTYAVIKKITFEEYKKCYINIVVILSVIAILMFFSVNIGYLNHSLQVINGKGFQIALNHVVGWGNTVFNNRMCGLFHEPGMFQIIINIALLYLVDNVAQNGCLNGYKLKAFILIIAVLLTRSTAGYLMMSYILAILYIRHASYIKRTIDLVLNLIVLTFVLISCFFIATSDVVLNKLDQNNISYNIRLNDFYSGIKMIIEKPFLGYGYNSGLYVESSRMYEIDSISNGLISAIIMFGVPAIVILIILVINSLKKNEWHFPLLVVFLFYILEQMVESCFFFPISLAFFFVFKKKWGCTENCVLNIR